MHLAVAEALRDDLLPALAHLAASLGRKADEFASVVKSGRTHLMDATPGDPRPGVRRLRRPDQPGGRADRGRPRPRRRGAPRRHGRRHRHQRPAGLRPGGHRRPGRAHRSAASPRPGTTSPPRPARDGLVDASGLLRVIAVALVKIANDLRWMGSGPRTGLAEIRIPDLQPGSSIMPGKVNPVIPEAVTQVAAQVIGNDAAVAFGGSQGTLELNVFMPMMAHNLLESIRLLTNVSRVFADTLHRRHRGQRGAVPGLRRVVARPSGRRSTPTSATRRRPPSSSGRSRRTRRSARSSSTKASCPTRS